MTQFIVEVELTRNGKKIIIALSARKRERGGDLKRSREVGTSRINKER
jgi:hypothetical protein